MSVGLTSVFVDLKQGSPEWHEWRRGVLGASDAGTILGVNPFKTARHLWDEKVGLAEPEPENEAMRRGTRLEPLARSAFEVETGYDMPPACCYAKEYPFIGASLDGFRCASEDRGHAWELGFILEIKCGASIYAKMAARKPIPDYYQAQIQQQLMVAGAEMCYFWAFDPELGGILRHVTPDVDLQAKLLDALVKFWESVQSRIAPDEAEQVRADKSWLDAAMEYHIASDCLEGARINKQEAEAALIALATHDRTRGGGLLLTRGKPRRPSIKWESAAKELADVLGEPVDWEKFRPAADSSEPIYRITKEKE